QKFLARSHRLTVCRLGFGNPPLMFEGYPEGVGQVAQGWMLLNVLPVANVQALARQHFGLCRLVATWEDECQPVECSGHLKALVTQRPPLDRQSLAQQGFGFGKSGLAP